MVSMKTRLYVKKSAVNTRCKEGSKKVSSVVLEFKHCIVAVFCKK